MARAKRYYIPGHVWHLTHRCHKKEFLLKFSRDRQRWLEWLFEAKKRYGIRVLKRNMSAIESGQRVSLPAPLNALAYLTGVGSKQFIEKVKEKLGFRARGRKVSDAENAAFQLREAQSIYGDDSPNIDFVTENTFLWDI